MLILYSFLYRVLTPLLILRLFLRSREAPAYRKRIAERWGFFKVDFSSLKPLHEANHENFLQVVPELVDDVQQVEAAFEGSSDDVIWVHSVSVGESIAIAPLVKRLMQQWPNKKFVVTTMTPTGSEQVRNLYEDSVFHVYAPYDTPGAVRRFLNRVKPSMLILVETELWPNMIHQCHRRGVKTLLLNARLSEKSAAGYQKPLVAGLSRGMMSELDYVAAQSEADGKRFLELGLDANKLAVVGSVKFDVRVEDYLREHATAIKTELIKAGKQKVLIAASTHEQEDEIILRACRSLFDDPSFLLILVPRHPERFEKVHILCKSRTLNVAKVTEGIANAQEMQVLLVDKMGMLMQMYGVADVAFVAGSLLPHLGGHNLLEPAAWALPVISGEHLTNFIYVRDLLLAADGLKIVTDAQELNSQLEDLFADGSLRVRLGENALSVVEQNRGALEKQLELVLQQQLFD